MKTTVVWNLDCTGWSASEAATRPLESLLDHSCFPEYSDHAELVADPDHTDQVVVSKVTAAESDNTAAGTACMVSSEAGKSVADTDCTAGAEEVDTGNRQKQERLLTIRRRLS